MCHPFSCSNWILELSNAGGLQRGYTVSFPASSAEADLEKNVILVLNAVPLDSMRRYVTHSSIIMLSHSHIVPIAYLYLVDSPPDLYGLWMHMIKGLTGSQAAWTSQKYRGHRTLPDTILAELNNANII